LNNIFFIDVYSAQKTSHIIVRRFTVKHTTNALHTNIDNSHWCNQNTAVLITGRGIMMH